MDVLSQMLIKLFAAAFTKKKKKIFFNSNHCLGEKVALK